MQSSALFSLAADAVLLLHALFVAFVVLGLVLILLGKLRAWRWVRNPWFRTAHLAAIGIVVAQSWLGIACPLTTLERALRERAGESVSAGSFIGHWLQRLIFFEAPGWVFVTAYTLFGALVVASWFWVRPASFGGARGSG